MDPVPAPSRLGGIAVVTVLALTLSASAVVLLAPSPGDDGLGGLPGPVVHPSRVGTQPYDGPVTATEVQAACATTSGNEAIACWTETLTSLLEGKGAIAAFDALEGLTFLDPLAYGQGHALAHGLGRYAFDAYGSIGAALTNCSFKVFGGCVHGALQNYFDSLGRPVQASDIKTVCPTEPAFEEYTCLHGLGHGLMLNLNYDLNRSLQLCDALSGWFAQGSCYGGVFMENWVGYLNSISPTAAGGSDHEHGPPPVFFVRADDPSYPCNIVAAKYGDGCWIMQTSIMLHFNGRNFDEAGRVCEGVTPWEHSYTCFKSLGRDVGPHTNRDIVQAELLCGRTPSGAGPCIKGVIAEMTLNAVDPMVGLNACKQLQGEVTKTACYEEFAWQSVGMVGDAEMERICALSEAGYADDCRRGAEL